MVNKKGRFGNKLLIAMLITALVPIFVFIISTYYLIENNILNKGIEAKYIQYSNEIEKIVAEYENKEVILESIEANYDLISKWTEDKKDSHYIESYLNRQKQISENFLSVYMTLKNGTDYNFEGKTDEIDTRLRYWYVKTLSNDKLTWIDPYIDLITGERVISITIPVRNKFGESVGVLGADIKFEEALNRIEDIKIIPKAKTYIFNEYWYPISEISKSEFTHVEFEKIKELFKNKEPSYEIAKLDKEYVIGFEEIGFNGWKVISIIEHDSFVDALLPLVSTYIIIGILVILLVLFFTKKFSKKITNPLKKLEEISESIINGNYDRKIEINTNDEFEELADVFNSMIENINQSKSKMEYKNFELAEMNEQLQDMNIELEASLEQLTATMSLLDNSEEKYRTLMENMYDIVFLVDADINISFVNKQFMKVFDYKASKIIGKPMIEFIRELELKGKYTCEEVVKNISTNDIKNFEITVKTPQGRWIFFEANSKLIYKYGVIISSQVVLKDITDRKNAEQYLYNRNKELMVVNRISSRINSTLKEEELYVGVAKDITNMMEIDSCSIRILEENSLNLKSFESNIKGWELEDEIIIDRSILENVLNKDELITINDFEQNDVFGMFNQKNKKIFKDNDIKEIIYIPLNDRNKLNGIITIAGKRNIEDNVGNIVTSISRQLSMMIENIKLYKTQKVQYLSTIRALVAAEEAKDKYTEGHSLRVAEYSTLIAQKMKIGEKIIEDIETGAILHDIGKIGISDEILNKTKALSNEEYKEIQKHPEIGFKILNNIDFSKTILNSVLLHHTRYDLKGYPSLKINKLPIEAAIIGVADAFDAMTSSRAYRKAMKIDEAIIELKRNRESQFNPEVVDLFIDIIENDREKLREIIEGN